MMNKKIQVIKIGGDIVDDENCLDQMLRSLAALPHPRILVHGGGIILNTVAEKLSIPVKMIDGRRITDAQTLDVALMVYAGLINTKIVARLQALKCRAVGLSGADGGVVCARKRPVQKTDYGLVGDITAINSEFLMQLLASGYVPVLCALSHDECGQMLNTNADTISSETAVALVKHHVVHLTYVSGQPGVMTDLEKPGSLIRHLDPVQYADLQTKRKISGGMLPKLHNGFHALENGVKSVNITDVNNIGISAGTVLQLAKN